MQATETKAGESAAAAAAAAETQERFLREIARRLPLDRVAEVHVFPAMRQGGVETGLAVIAARREAPSPESQPEPFVEAEGAAEGGGAGDAGAGDEGVAGAPPRLQDAPADGAEHNPSDAERSDAAAAEPEAATGPSADGEPAALPERHTVFSARYRLTLKGPDRGKWEVDIVDEADAPLVTVDAVVRGVQRRAGEGADPERFTAEQLRALLQADAPPAAR